MAKKTNNGANGGELKGDSHSAPSGGIHAVVGDSNTPVLLEGEEIIINKKSSQDPNPRHQLCDVDGDNCEVKTNKEILSDINSQDGRGVKILEDGGEVGVYGDGGEVGSKMVYSIYESEGGINYITDVDLYDIKMAYDDFVNILAREYSGDYEIPSYSEFEEDINQYGRSTVDIEEGGSEYSLTAKVNTIELSDVEILSEELKSNDIRFRVASTGTIYIPIDSWSEYEISEYQTMMLTYQTKGTTLILRCILMIFQVLTFSLLMLIWL